jgi:hypothetical protein
MLTSKSDKWKYFPSTDKVERSGSELKKFEPHSSYRVNKMRLTVQIADAFITIL